MNSSTRKFSISCANCRAVKRRCDKKRPHCGQCVRLSQECPGYRDKWDLIFRDQTNLTVQRAKQADMAKTNRSSHSPPRAQSRDELRQPALVQAVPSGAMVSSQLFSSYLDDYFPRRVKPTCAVNLSFPIISTIYTLPQKSPMLQKATSALSCIFLGKTHGDKPLLQYGISLYNGAIHEMSKALSRRDYKADLVYTCSVFEQIEIHHCPDSLDKWYAHIDGLSAIMRLYQPKKGDSPIMDLIYGQHQKFRVLLSRLMRLSEPVVRWLKEPGDGLLYELTQLLTDLSCLAAALDKSSDHQARQSLLEDCLALERRHLKFYTEISANGTYEDPPTYQRGEIKSGLRATDDLFGPAYRFHSVGEANLHIFLWTSLSLLYPIIYQAYALTGSDEIPQIFRIDGHPPQQAAHQLSALHVSKALRCLPYCAQEGLNLWAIYFCIFPAIQATRVFSQARDWERFIWATEVFQYSALSGFDHAARYRDLCYLYWFDPAIYGTGASYRLPDPTDHFDSGTKHEIVPTNSGQHLIT